jgi:H+/gluconate symporter-like permease
MGIVAALFMFILGYLYLTWREKKLREKGEVFTEPKVKSEGNTLSDEELPNPLLSILPLITVIVTLNVFDLNIIVALLSGIVLSMALNYKKYKGFTKSINNGASGSVLAIINTSAAVGFGSVVKAVPGFQNLTEAVMNIKGTPLISEAIAVNILAGATGSASGGMGIALEALGEKYYQIALETGISPEAFHRVASLASGGLDTLPHNGAVLTLLAVTGMTHKESYIDIFVTSLLLPVLSSIPAIILASFGIY